MRACALHAEGDPVEARLAQLAPGNAASTDSGLASVVTSASGASPNSSRTAASMRPRSAAGSSVGVPPPTKTVETRRRSSPSTFRASRISSTSGVRVVLAGGEHAAGAAQLGRGVGVEVAVAAAGGAVRHVQVEAEGLGLAAVEGRRGERAVVGHGLAVGQCGGHAHHCPRSRAAPAAPVPPGGPEAPLRVRRLTGSGSQGPGHGCRRQEKPTVTWSMSCSTFPSSAGSRSR